MIVVVMGVSGSGKTTVGKLLAAALECAYLEGDSLHPARNVEKMSRGIPLTDEDRTEWLTVIRERTRASFDRGESLVVGCSALKQSYREILSRDLPVSWVYLKGSAELIRARLVGRTGHFMPPTLLDSQIEALEEPVDAVTVDISLPPDVIVGQLLTRLGRREVRVCADADELGRRAAEATASTIAGVVAERGRCSLVMSGGSTPRDLYRQLAGRFRDTIPWAQIHLFWSDERYVPHDDPRSNYRMVRETLLDAVAPPAGNIHPMPTHHRDPDDAAREYEATISRYFAGEPPAFDLALLGLGADGHTASLLPGSDALGEGRRWVVPATLPAEPPLRLTLTLPVLSRSAVTYFLVTGSMKAGEVARALDEGSDPEVYPAAALQRGPGRVVWWLDREAAAELDRGGSPAAGRR